MRNRFFYLRLLRASLFAGGAYDLAFAVALLLAPAPVGRLLRVPLPGEPLYLWLIAVLLAMVGALFLAAGYDPRRYTAVVLVATAGRCAGALALALAALTRSFDGLWAPAGIELAFGLAHGWLWSRVR